MPSFLDRIKQNVATLKAIPGQITSFILIQASKYNQTWCIAALLSWGADAHATDAQKNTALHYAALNNNAKLAEVLIKHGAIIQGAKARNKELQTPWSIATKQFATGINNLNLLGALLGLARSAYKTTGEFHKDVAIKTLFKEVQEKSSLALLDKLVTKIDINALDATDNNLLNYAALLLDEPAVQLLMKHGAILDPRQQLIIKSTWDKILEQPELDYKTTRVLGLLLKIPVDNFDKDKLIREVATKALLKAAEAAYSNFKHLKKFIALGADVNAQNKDGNTLLHFAARNNAIIAMTTLLQNGADLNIRNKVGEQPIHFAARFHANDEHNEINGTLELLLKNGAAPNSEDYRGNTPLHNAASSSFFTTNAADDPELTARVLKTFNILLDNAADATILNNKQQTPLHIAVLNSNVVAIKFFLERNNEFGLDRDEHGNIPLHYIFKLPPTREPIIPSRATMHKQNSIIQELKQYNWLEQLLTKNNVGRTPLHMLIEESPPITFIKTILKSIPKEELPKLIAATDEHGNTLLHIASEYSSEQLYKPKHQIKFAEKIAKLEKNALAIADLLIKLGWDLQAKNSAGDTPIAIAAQNKTFTKLLEQSNPQDALVVKKNLLMSPDHDQHSKPEKRAGRTIVYPTPKKPAT